MIKTTNTNPIAKINQKTSTPKLIHKRKQRANAVMLARVFLSIILSNQLSIYWTNMLLSVRITVSQQTHHGQGELSYLAVFITDHQSTNIHFVEYPGKENNITFMEQSIARCHPLAMHAGKDSGSVVLSSIIQLSLLAKLKESD